MSVNPTRGTSHHTNPAGTLMPKNAGESIPSRQPTVSDFRVEYGGGRWAVLRAMWHHEGGRRRGKTMKRFTLVLASGLVAVASSTNAAAANAPPFVLAGNLHVATKLDAQMSRAFVVHQIPPASTHWGAARIHQSVRHACAGKMPSLCADSPQSISCTSEDGLPPGRFSTPVANHGRLLVKHSLLS